MPATATLVSLSARAERLVALGVPELGEIAARELRSRAGDGPGLLVVHPHTVAPSALTPLLGRELPGRGEDARSRASRHPPTPG